MDQRRDPHREHAGKQHQQARRRRSGECRDDRNAEHDEDAGLLGTLREPEQSRALD